MPVDYDIRAKPTCRCHRLHTDPTMIFPNGSTCFPGHSTDHNRRTGATFSRAH